MMSQRLLYTMYKNTPKGKGGIKKNNLKEIE